MIGTATLLVAPNLFANIIGSGTATVTYNWPPGGDALLNVAVGSSSGANLGSAFSSFCLNSGVDIGVPGTYNYTVSDDKVLLNNAPISIGTAWLYSQFRAGTLGNGYGDNATENGLLQAAIWWLQGQTGGDENNFVTAAATALSLSDLALTGAATGNLLDGVVVLNFQNANGAYVQPLLGWVAPVPEPSTVVAGALLLLPFGVSTLRIMRKNKMQ